MSGTPKYTPEQDAWLKVKVLECREAGYSNYQAAKMLTDDWNKFTGRHSTPTSLYGIVQRVMGVNLSVSRSRVPAEPSPEEVSMAHASYAVYIPPRGKSKNPTWEFFSTPNEAQEYVYSIIAENRGYFPEGLKIFGEIVVETNVSVVFKARGMSPQNLKATNSPEIPKG